MHLQILHILRNKELPKIKHVHPQKFQGTGVLAPDRPAFHAGEAAYMYMLQVKSNLRSICSKLGQFVLTYCRSICFNLGQFNFFCFCFCGKQKNIFGTFDLLFILLLFISTRSTYLTYNSLTPLPTSQPLLLHVSQCSPCEP